MKHEKMLPETSNIKFTINRLTKASSHLLNLAFVLIRYA